MLKFDMGGEPTLMLALTDKELLTILRDGALLIPLKRPGLPAARLILMSTEGTLALDMAAHAAPPEVIELREVDPRGS